MIKKVLILKWMKCLEALKIDTKSFPKDLNKICRIADDKVAYNSANEKEKKMSNHWRMSFKNELEKNSRKIKFVERKQQN